MALTDYTVEDQTQAPPGQHQQHQQSYGATGTVAVGGEAAAASNPVNGLLTNLQQQHQPTGPSYPGPPQHSSWNPDKNPQERHQVMPIITPTYPHINSTFNVTPSTLKLIQEKMTRAEELCQKIFKGEEKWETLFKVNVFLFYHLLNLIKLIGSFQTNHIFHEYHHLLLIIVCARNNYIQWFGLIESKIRHFISNVEKESYMYLQSARQVKKIG